MDVIDAHIHLWRAEAAHPIWVRDAIGALPRTCTLDDYFAASDAARAIVIEAAGTLAETVDLFEQFADDPRIAGVVGSMDLGAADLAPTLDRLAAFPRFKGVRLVTAFGSGQEVEDLAHGLSALAERGLTLDLLAAPAGLSVVGEIIAAAPGLTIVVNHCGRPLVMCGSSDRWDGAMTEIASHPGTYCKLSGLIERAGFEWTTAELAPFVSRIVDLFGPDRLLFATNWPMCELTGRAQRWKDALAVILAGIGLGPPQVGAIMGGNAARAYRVAPTAEAGSRA